MQIKKLHLSILFLACVMVGGSMVFNMAFLAPQTFTHVTLAEWVQSGSFTPVVLWPEPAGTDLSMGPLQGAGRVELYYSEQFESGTLPVVYEFYESNKPLPIGKNVRSGILPYYDTTSKDVESEWVDLVLHGAERAVELRRNSNQGDAGIAIFEISGTHVVFHWKNVDQHDALQALADGITRVDDNDLELISRFDQELRSSP
ncbi:MAG: hypothetical protein V9H69_09500 [Anaerolineae bacterium]|jgi:hypothetical protein